MTHRLLWSAVFLVCWRLQSTLGEGNVGCLFSSLLCDPDEACHDDNAFGRCQPSYHSPRDSYRHILGPETLRLLEHEMRRLFSGGYRWSHQYTQCVIQNILDAERHHRSYDPGLCARIMRFNLPSVPEEIIKELEGVGPEDMAFIRFHPSKTDGEAIYADEEFIPPGLNEMEYGELDDRVIDKRKMSTGVRETDEEDGELNAEFLRYIMQVAQDAEGLLDEDQGSSDSLPNDNVPVVKTDLSSDLNLRPAFSEGGVEWLPVEDSSATNEDTPWLADIENTKEDDGAQLLDALSRNKDTSGSEWTMSDWPPAGGTYNTGPNSSDGAISGRDEQNPDSLGNDIMDIKESLLQDSPSMPTFQRPLRYDIKKPGPGYYVHEQDSTEKGEEQMSPLDGKLLYHLLHAAQKDQLNTLEGIREENAKLGRYSDPIKDIIDDELDLKDLLPVEQTDSLASPVAIETDFGERQSTENLNKAAGSSSNIEVQDKRNYRPEPAHSLGTLPPPSGKEQLPDFSRVSEGPQGHYEAVDATHAYILVEQFPTSTQGEELVQRLEQILRLPRGSFSNIRTEKSQVTFKVNPNPQGLNASDVAAKAEDLKKELRDSTGLNVVAAGIGDKVKFEVVGKSNDRRLFILTFVLCGGVVGILIAVVVVYVVRRHARSRQKLQNLAHPETEASQDYQDLCRQRMASKNNEKPEPIHAAQSPKRVRSLSQSDPQQQSSSSHSSTSSSWNEEPVTSNMDISTGHMILAYMEDHLKNKDRLDREWEALCAYEAEPCSTGSSTLPQNIKKNRYTDVLPYDHSRVVLNDVSNVSGADYINASTITDHDPRNPAYIAAQGPLPHTAADFWQMIWEQGSVVMVMLTRLMENGVAMCYRYWPEEDSEIYHIYEVHLVSEHIWCDDYLVRSFYLKNLRTSETRTVTQFHFLSWPDNGVPSSTKALLEFRRKVNKSYRGRSCPVVVHCSDGIGRTGTYCLIDMVLNRMAKGAKEIDIAATLEHIRDQRGGMVKTKAQFEFVLMAVAEEVHAILKALSQ